MKKSIILIFILFTIKTVLSIITYDIKYKGDKVSLNYKLSEDFRCVMNIQNLTDKTLRFSYYLSKSRFILFSPPYNLTYCFHNRKEDDCVVQSNIRFKPYINFNTNYYHNDINRQNYSFVSLFIVRTEAYHDKASIHNS